MAQNFMNSKHSSLGINAAPAKGELRLLHAELGEATLGQPTYYIFDTNGGYVVVAGDDRAKGILAYGNGTLDMNRLPCGFQALLDTYNRQIGYLLSHPELKATSNSRLISCLDQYPSIEPILASTWGQSEPFYNECPVYQGQRCVTGCCCTSTSMVMHFWKYPASISAPIPAYTTYSYRIALEELPPTSFDWDNMLNHYGSGYTEEQATAVAHLMRYVGQAEQMDYGPDGSASNNVGIAKALKAFNYDDGYQSLSKTLTVGYNYVYDNERWAAIMLKELALGRPLIYGGSTSEYGHSFNVDGFDAETKTFHVNFGWGGYADGYCALNAFEGDGDVFNQYQDMIIFVQPPLTEPTINNDLTQLNFNIRADKSQIRKFKIHGRMLTNITKLTLNDPNGVFKLNASNISVDRMNAKAGYEVSVTFTPTSAGIFTASIKVSSQGANDVTINLTGNAFLETYDPEILPASDMTSSSLTANWQDATPAENVSCYRLELNRHPFFEERLTETFDKEDFTGVSTTDWSSKLDEITTTPGWTGKRVYRSEASVMLGGSSSKGWLTTPAVSVEESEGKVTVRLKAKCPSNTNEALLTVSCGDHDTIVSVVPEEKEFCLLLPCPDSGTTNITFANRITGRRVQLNEIHIIAGDDFTPIDPAQATRYENLTGTSAVINGLQPGGYIMRVQAIYIDGWYSQWSDYTLAMLNWPNGDVNHDNEINVADVNTLIGIILGNHVAASIAKSGDINGDGEINVADINAIIDMILN